jgi:hypothetical protein
MALGLKVVQNRTVADRPSQEPSVSGSMPARASWARPGEAPPRQQRIPVTQADDLSFGAAINAALVVIDAVHSLVWSFSNGPLER